MNTIHVTIVTPNDGLLFEADAKMVVTLTTAGMLGVLPRHIELISTLEVTTVRVELENETRNIAVSGGFIEVRPDQVNILANTAELSEKINLERAESSKYRAEKRLSEKLNNKDIDVYRAQLALRRAVNRIEAYKNK